MPGAGIRIDASLDDREAALGLRRVAARAGRLAPALDEIGSRLVASTIRRFETETAPSGAPWKKSRRAAEQRGQTLTDSGRLRASITHNVIGATLEVGTNVAYAAIHQLGGRTPPRTIRPKRKRALYWPGAAHPVASVDHPGSEIPSRPFLGLDAGDRRAIRRIVARHLEAAP